MEQRLQKLLAAAGVASRREAEKLISAGRVAIDGKVVTQLGAKADPEQNTITVDGQPVNLKPQKYYILLNKPRGYASTCRDPHAQRTIMDLVHSLGVKVYPVGRLDVDTEGLLILTNDGDFAVRITHPRHQIPKTYRAEVKGLVTQETLHCLTNGVKLDDGKISRARVQLVGLYTARHTSVLEIIITEGRKRQIRRMLDAVGHPVTRLVRTRIGDITIGKLKPGEWRFLTEQEIKNLLTINS